MVPLPMNPRVVLTASSISLSAVAAIRTCATSPRAQAFSETLGWHLDGGVDDETDHVASGGVRWTRSTVAGPAAYVIAGSANFAFRAAPNHHHRVAGKDRQAPDGL
jgi:hypothetical protein